MSQQHGLSIPRMPPVTSNGVARLWHSPHQEALNRARTYLLKLWPSSPVRAVFHCGNLSLIGGLPLQRSSLIGGILLEIPPRNHDRLPSSSLKDTLQQEAHPVPLRQVSVQTVRLGTARTCGTHWAKRPTSWQKSLCRGRRRSEEATLPSPLDPRRGQGHKQTSARATENSRMTCTGIRTEDVSEVHGRVLEEN